MKERVRYYSPKDLLYAHNLTKIELLQIPTFETITINDAIEYYQMKKYFDSGTRAKTWTDDDFEKYKDKCDTLCRLTKRYFNQINDDNIIGLYKDIEFGYHSAFWELFDNCKLYNIISSTIFATLISCDNISLNDILLHKFTVDKYGELLRRYILSNEYSITILLYVYEQDYTGEEKLILPIELTGEDIIGYIDNYIDSELSNSCYNSDVTLKKTRTS